MHVSTSTHTTGIILLTTCNIIRKSNVDLILLYIRFTSNFFVQRKQMLWFIYFT